MNFSLFQSMRSKLIVLFLIVALLPLLIVGMLLYNQSHNLLTEEITNRLSTILDIKTQQIQAYFTRAVNDINLLAQNPTTIEATQAFEELNHTNIEVGGITDYRTKYLNQPDSIANPNAYDKIHSKYHAIFAKYKKVYGYYDIFIIEPHTGYILYTVEKENDFGTSLVNGPYANTNLSQVFKAVVDTKDKDFTSLEDFSYYAPSQSVASFIAAPIFNASKLIGVIVLQLSTNKIDSIMQANNGLGDNGETVLIGANDFLLRSNSRFAQDSLFKMKWDNQASRTKGETGIKKIIDDNDKTMLVAYAPLKISGLNWSLHAKIDWNEAVSGMQFMQLWSIFIVGVSIIIIISIAILVSNSFISPIKAITDAANKLTAGNMTISLDIERKDEIGQLAQSFQQMANDMSKIIADIVQVSHGLAKGDLNVVTKEEYHGDFIQIKQSLEEALHSLCAVIKDIVLVSKELANGNLNTIPQIDEYHGDFIQIQTALTVALSNKRKVIEDIVYVSEKLLLGEFNYTSQTEYKGDFAKIEGVLATLSSNLRFLVTDIVQVSQDLSAGKEITPQAEYVGSFTKIKTALENASLQLVVATEKNNLQDWLKTGQNQLNDQMSGEQNIVELTHNIVSFLTLYLDAQIGLCYAVEKSTNLSFIKLIASYAHNRRKNITDEFEFTKGLVERAVKEQKTISIEVASDLSDAVPKYITLIPFLYENTVKGVILLGNSKQLTNTRLEFIAQVMPTVGVAVNSVEARNKMQELLQRTQIQAQELEQQQEELQHNNEELQSQSEELQTQTAELQNQSEELQRSNDSLEERTKELERQKQEITDKNTTLVKIKQDIETKANEIELASKYKSEFLANMSHELRTPLNSLLILAQLLADNKNQNLTDKQVEYARTIHNSGVDLLRLINDVLDLSKVEAGKIEINIEDVLLTDLVTNIEKEFRPLAENKGLGFQITIADDIPQILYTDGQRLKQIINNLLSNAFKFTAKGEIKITIRHPSRHNDITKYKPNETIVIGVTDTGIGIPKDKQESIFTAFQQADGTTSRNYGGTGLGLSISRQLAHLLGGELELRSEENNGSSFTLYLPQKFEESDSVGPNDSKTFIDVSKPIGSNLFIDDRENLLADDKSLLIIEDDFTFVNILLETARDKDFKCLVADDGEAGLQLAEQYQPDAVILDVNLPKIDGLTVMERLKDNPNTKDILVHLISASELSSDATDMAVGYLRKPVNMEQLSNAFKQIEQLITKQVKNLLVISDLEAHKQQILDLVQNDDIKITQATTIDEALHSVQNKVYDCVILDMDIEHHSSTELIKQMHDAPDSCKTPVIIYTEQDLTPNEETLLQKCADNLILKSSRSPARLLDEATLFLHQLEAKLPEGKHVMLKMVHNKTAILKDKKALIVDDDIRNVFALVTVLEDNDMEVVVAKNGEEALILLDKQLDIAIILMDIMMPAMDGYETMQKIRKQPKYKKLPIIALTAKAMRGDKAKCIEAGANDYLAKPVDSNKLVSLMRVWLYQ